MSLPGKVLLVSGSDYTPEIYAGLQPLKNELNLSFSLLSDGSYSPPPGFFTEHFAFDLRRTEETLQSMASATKIPFDAVTQKSSEWLSPLVALLQVQNRIKATPPRSAFLCRSKLHMRERMREANLPHPPFILAQSFEELWQGAEELGFPVVAKPVGGNASYGTFLIQSASEKEIIKSRYQAAIHYLSTMSIDQDVFSFSPSELASFGVSEFVDLTTDYLVEKFIPGRTVSVDSLVTADGTPHPIAVALQTRMPPPFFLQQREILPAPLPLEVLNEIYHLNQITIRAFGICRSAVHLEVILSDTGLVLLELGARIGGDNIHHSVLATTGIHLMESLVRLSLDQPVDFTPKALGYSATEYLLPSFPDHMVHRIEEVNSRIPIDGNETVLPSVGSTFANPPIRFDVPGYVTAFGATPESAITEAQKRAALVTFRTTPLS